MTSPNLRAREGAVPDRGLNRPSRDHLFTSYHVVGPASSGPDDEIEVPLLTGPHDVLLSDATVISFAVDAAEWPDWTDEVAFGAGRGGAR